MFYIVSSPKYHRKEIYKTIKRATREIFRKFCNEMKVESIKAKECADIIHILISIPSYMSVAQFKLKYRYGSRNFGVRGYFVEMVGKNKKLIANYIKNQFEEDYTEDQILFMEFADSFTSKQNKLGKAGTYSGCLSSSILLW